MARNQQLGDVIEKALIYAKYQTNASRGPDFREHAKNLIISRQKFYYDEFDWPFMNIIRGEAEKSIAAGQRYYDFPTKLSQEHSFALYYKHSNVWIKLEQGITLDDYSTFDSDNDERSEPLLKWDFYGETQFEVWPLPSTTGTVRFLGKKALTALVQEEDTLDLDDEMIALSVAGTLATKDKLQRELEGRAERRYWQQRAVSAKDIKVRVGLGDEMMMAPPMTATGWPRTIAVYNERS